MPEKFGNYAILRKIATGGMAGVYLAKHSGVGGFERLVCIKRILPHLGEQEDFVKMFMDEARIAANLLHPNIAQIYEIDCIDGDYFIAMEYVHGQDVRKIYNQEVTRGQAMGQEPGARIIAGAASGLDYAHQQSNLDGQALNIVHRDISPQNILVTYHGYVKLVDFGVAKAAGKMAETRSGVLKGKYSYMSPEQAMGDQVDARTDIFALGITLYEVTTGTRLFKKETDLETLHAVIECDVTHPSEIIHDYDRHLEAIILKALAKDRDDRYDTAGQMAEELEGFLSRRKYPPGAGRLAEYMQDLFADTLADEALFGGRLWEETNTKPRYGKGGTLISDAGRRADRISREETDVTSMIDGSAGFGEGWDPSATPGTGWGYANSKSASMTATQVDNDLSVPEPHLGGQTAITAQRSRSSTPHLPRPPSMPATQGILSQLKPVHIFGIAALALIFGVMVTLLLTRATPSMNAEPRSGPLVVDSEPRGVTVVFSGQGAEQVNKRYGERRTPFTIQEGIVIGPPLLARFSKETYLSIERELPPLESDVRPEPLFVELKRKQAADAVGTLILFSKPHGARVKIDGQRIEGQTPLNNVYVKAKVLHQVEFELAGYKKRIETLTVLAGNQKVLEVVLSPDANAQIPKATSSVQENQPRVENIDTSVLSNEAKKPKKPKNLPRLAAKGRLNLNSNVSVDVKTGRKFLGTAPLEGVPLKAGRHKIRLENEDEGFYLYKSVNVRSGKTSTIDIHLGKGTFSTNAKPWAKVKVGKASGKDTPARFELFEGTYRVEFECPNKEILSRTITIKPKATSSLVVDCNANAP